MEPIFLQRCVLKFIKLENLKNTCYLDDLNLTIITIYRDSLMHR